MKNTDDLTQCLGFYTLFIGTAQIHFIFRGTIHVNTKTYVLIASFSWQNWKKETQNHVTTWYHHYRLIELRMVFTHIPIWEPFRFPTLLIIWRLSDLLCSSSGLREAGRYKKEQTLAHGPYLPLFYFIFYFFYFSKWNKYALIPSNQFSGTCCREVYESY